MEEKIKHLEFIQNAISRMCNNSFIIKGWTITLVAALVAISTQSLNKDYLLINYFILIVFWYLDGFYISCERRFRALYEDVRLQKSSNFNMSTKQYKGYKNSWIGGVLSKTLWPLYGLSLIVHTALLHSCQKLILWE